MMILRALVVVAMSVCMHLDHITTIALRVTNMCWLLNSLFEVLRDFYEGLYIYKVEKLRIVLSNDIDLYSVFSIHPITP